MNKVFQAKIKWMSSQQGGRQSLPFSIRYAPFIVIKGIPFNPNENIWSIFVENKETVAELETIAEIRYLSENAPNNLDKGVEFDLFEGVRKVASGIVL